MALSNYQTGFELCAGKIIALLLAGARHLMPRLEGVGTQLPIVTRFQQMLTEAEQISHLTVHREKSLCLSGRFEAPRLPLLLGGRLVRCLTSIIRITVLAMGHVRHHFFLRRAIAPELIGDHPIRRSPLMLEHLLEKALRHFFVFAFLHQDIDHLAVLIDGSPQIESLTVDGHQHDFIQVSIITQ